MNGEEPLYPYNDMYIEEEKCMDMLNSLPDDGMYTCQLLSPADLGPIS